MDKIKRASIITLLIGEMRELKSWCGETHLQKAVYFLQKLLEVPLEYEYIFYKHGPFSFDLREELVEFRADNIVQYEVMPPPYGPRLIKGPNASLLSEESRHISDEYRDRVLFVAKNLRDSAVAELERLGTALYVTLGSSSGDNVEKRAAIVNELKAHVSIENAIEAVKKIDKIIEEATEAFGISVSRAV